MRRLAWVFVPSVAEWRPVAVFVTLIGFLVGAGVAARACYARHPVRGDAYARTTRCDGYAAAKQRKRLV
jgi:hypothetical protein